MIMRVRSTARRTVGWLAGILVLCAAAGCSVSLISEYDEVLDRGASDLQQQMDRHLTRLERRAGTPAAAYPSHEEFYVEYAASLRSLRTRAAVQPRNDITVEQLDLMLQNLSLLEDQHARASLSAPAAAAMRDQFNQAWEAILRLETAKRRGDD